MFVVYVAWSTVQVHRVVRSSDQARSSVQVYMGTFVYFGGEHLLLAGRTAVQTSLESWPLHGNPKQQLYYCCNKKKTAVQELLTSMFGCLFVWVESWHPIQIVCLYSVEPHLGRNPWHPGHEDETEDYCNVINGECRDFPMHLWGLVIMGMRCPETHPSWWSLPLSRLTVVGSQWGRRS